MRILAGIIATLLLTGCAGETTQLYMKESDGTTREIVYPKGTFFGGSSQQQAGALARIFVDSHNMAMRELSKVEELKAMVGKSLSDQETMNMPLQKLEELNRANLDTARKTLAALERMSSRQGTGEITMFYPVVSYRIKRGSLDYQRLVNFADYLMRESRGRKVLFISIGSASAFGKKATNEKLAQRRADAPLDILDKYLVNLPHEFYKVYGTGDIYSPRKVSRKEHRRYQHTRVIAFFEKEQIPSLPAAARAE